MAVGGERPESGVRILVERDRSATDPPWRYTGAAHLPAVSFPLSVVVDGSGDVKVTLSASESEGAAPPADLPEKVRLIVRSVFKQAAADGQPPAWRIVRWRGEK